MIEVGKYLERLRCHFDLSDKLVGGSGGAVTDGRQGDLVLVDEADAKVLKLDVGLFERPEDLVVFVVRFRQDDHRLRIVVPHHLPEVADG